MRAHLHGGVPTAEVDAEVWRGPTRWTCLPSTATVLITTTSGSELTERGQIKTTHRVEPWRRRPGRGSSALSTAGGRKRSTGLPRYRTPATYCIELVESFTQGQLRGCWTSSRSPAAAGRRTGSLTTSRRFVCRKSDWPGRRLGWPPWRAHLEDSRRRIDPAEDGCEASPARLPRREYPRPSPSEPESGAAGGRPRLATRRTRRPMTRGRHLFGKLDLKALKGEITQAKKHLQARRVRPSSG